MILKLSKYGFVFVALLGVIFFLSCERSQSLLPEINPEIVPPQGQTTTIFKFDLSETFGQDPNNKIFVRWDWEGDSIFDTPFVHESVLTHRYFASGKYNPRAEIKNLSGQSTDSSFHVEVITGYSSPRAAYKITPETGNPYTVFQFDASLTQDDEDSLSTLLFKWDFDGDGTWDTELNNQYLVEHVFPVVQGYFPNVYVVDPSKRANAYSQVLIVTLLDTCIVPYFTANSDSLVQNEESIFDASSSISACNNEEQLWYKWDFENDMIYDTEWLEDPVTSHVFPNEREYWVRLVVKNTKGLENSVIQKYWMYHQNQPPIAAINASTYGGNTRTEFRFDVWPTRDIEDSPSQMLNRWDFDGDGNWDTELSHEIEVFYIYNQPGIYKMALEMIDRGDLHDTVYETIYVRENNFETGRILDRKGSQWEFYGTVKIGDQWWMSKNLRVDDDYFYGNKAYDFDITLVTHYGYLYAPPKMYAACPYGWKIPSKEDWNKLFRNFEESEVYDELILGGNSGFNVVFGGMASEGRGTPFTFSRLLNFGYFWSSSILSSPSATSQWFITFDKTKSHMVQGYGPKQRYYSIRCIKE